MIKRQILRVPAIKPIGKKYIQLVRFIRRHARLLKFAIAFLLIAIVAAHLSFSASRRQGIENLQKDAASLLRLFSLRVFAPTDKYAYLPKFVSNYEVLTDALRHPQDLKRVQAANVLLDRLNTEAGSNLIYLIDLRGLTIASSNWDEPNSLVGNNYAFRPYFVGAVREGEGRFYAMGISTGVPGYFISSLVKDENNAPLGVVTVKIDMTNLDLGWDSGHQMMVADENNVIFLSSRIEWKYRPLWPLTFAAVEHLARTRQYEGVLEEPIPITVEETLRPGEQIVSIIQRAENGQGSEEVSYFLKASKLPGSNWTLNVLTPMKKVNETATQAAIIAVGIVAFLILSLMYFIQIFHRNQEREKSRLALEQKHQDLQALSEELRIRSITDPLTGVFNRRFFMESAAAMVSAANRHGYPLSIIMIDVDHFKQINDVHGHPAGDKVLQTLTALYKEELRDSDVFARFGGEEFIIALTHTEKHAAQIVAERMRIKVMNHPIEIDGKSLNISISSGISQHHLKETTVEEMVKRADEALYEAKRSGRNRVVLR